MSAAAILLGTIGLVLLLMAFAKSQKTARRVERVERKALENDHHNYMLEETAHQQALRLEKLEMENELLRQRDEAAHAQPTYYEPYKPPTEKSPEPRGGIERNRYGHVRGCECPICWPS